MHRPKRQGPIEAESKDKSRLRHQTRKGNKKDRVKSPKKVVLKPSSTRGGGNDGRQPPAENSGQHVIDSASLQREWDALLFDRPQETNNCLPRPISDWVSRVMSVSDRFTFGTEDPELIESKLDGDGGSGSESSSCCRRYCRWSWRKY